MAQKQITDLQTKSAVTDDTYIPSDDGIQSYKITPPQIRTYLQPGYAGPGFMSNVQLTASVGSSALTIAVKNNAGNNPSSTDKARIAFRSATAATGSYVIREISGALSLVVSSGSTLGHASTIARYIYVYLIDNAGTVELAVSSQRFDDGSVVSTTAEGGAGGADAQYVMYSTTARTTVACRLIGRMLSTQVTAGTWALVPSELSLYPIQNDKSALVAMHYGSTSGAAIGISGNPPVVYATKIYDTHNMFDGTSTFTTPFDGFYRITASFFTGSAAGIKIYKNGSFHISGVKAASTSANSFVAATLQLAATDTITIRPDVDSYTMNGAITNSYLMIEKVR